MDANNEGSVKPEDGQKNVQVVEEEIWNVKASYHEECKTSPTCTDTGE